VTACAIVVPHGQLSPQSATNRSGGSPIIWVLTGVCQSAAIVTVTAVVVVVVAIMMILIRITLLLPLKLGIEIGYLIMTECVYYSFII
jgi:hypothetical protein